MSDAIAMIARCGLHQSPPVAALDLTTDEQRQVAGTGPGIPEPPREFERPSDQGIDGHRTFEIAESA